MAVAVTVVASDVTSLKRAIVALTFSGTYTTGGETPSPTLAKTLSMSRFLTALFTQDDTLVSGGLLARLDRATGKIMLFETAGTVDLPFKELSSGASLTGVIFRGEVIGEGNN